MAKRYIGWPSIDKRKALPMTKPKMGPPMRLTNLSAISRYAERVPSQNWNLNDSDVEDSPQEIYWNVWREPAGARDIRILELPTARLDVFDSEADQRMLADFEKAEKRA